MLRFTLSLLLVLGVFLPHTAFAGEAESPLRFYDKMLKQYIQAPGIASDITIDVEGSITRTTVTQYFLNETQDWQEGVYTYPLPDNAAVDNLTMMIGNKRIIGFVHEKEEAKKIYKQAKQDGKAAGLVEQHRPNIFKTSVANIPPKSMIAIEIQYQADVALDNYIFSLRMPMAITPRYDRMNTKELMTFVSDAQQPWANEIVERMKLMDFAGGKNPVTLKATLTPGFDVKAIKSASHKIAVNKVNNVHRVVLKKEIIPGERDFTLNWTPKSTSETISTLHYEELDGDIYSHLLILPPQNMDDIKAAAPKRQVTYIIDTSGSMDGPSIKQAREALVQGLEDLNKNDYFNIIEFNSFHTKFFPEPLLATKENIRSAAKLVRELKADGGTEMIPAIQESFAETLIKGHLRQIVFITDGSIGYEDELSALIKTGVGNARFFAIGIGSAPNAHLMRSIAETGRGTFTFISDVKEIQKKLTTLFRKMKTPALTDLEIIIPDGIQAEIIPSKLPDLMAGEPVSVAIKADKLLKKIDISGRKANKPWTFSAKIPGPAESDGISKIYARRKITELENKDQHGNDLVVKAAITQLGIEHQVMSKYTSFVAVDEEIIRPSYEVLVSKNYDPTLPAGWQKDRIESHKASQMYKNHMQRKREEAAQNNLKKEISLPQTATGYPLSIAAGLLMMLLSMFLTWKGRRHGYQGT